MVSDFDFAGAIVPWGRSAEEYDAFFALGDVGEGARILDCGAGPSSFCAEWSRRGRRVVAADPLYSAEPGRIATEFDATALRMLEGMRRASGRFTWTRHESPEAVVEARRASLSVFLRDFEGASRGARYVGAALPHLPFGADAFDLALCSHLLFLYSAELGLEAHVAALREMLRVAPEVRVFPLLDMDGRLSTHLEPCRDALADLATAAVVDVPYELRVGDSRMLRLVRRQ